MQNSQTKLKNFLYPGNFKHYETTVNSYLFKNNSNFFLTSNKQLEKKNPLQSVYSISESTAYSDSIPLLKKTNYNSFKTHKEVSKTDLFPSNESEIIDDASDLNCEQIKIDKFRNYLSFMGKKNNFNDIESFKNKTFSDLQRKNGQDKDYDNFDIFYGAGKRRSTLLNDLNHRLFYKKTKTVDSFNVNFSTKLLEMKSKSFKNSNDINKYEGFKESSLLKRRSLKKIGSFSPKNKKKNIFSKIKPIDTNNLVKNFKNQAILPSSNRLKFKGQPLFLLKSISDHINHLKQQNCKIPTIQKANSIFFDLEDIESCFFDTDKKNFLDLPSPQTLYNKILLIERSRKTDNGILKNKNKHCNNLWLNNPFAKLSEETFNLLFSANSKLEQIRIDFEKENLKRMKDDLINQQEAVLEEKLRLLEIFKKKNKKHLYEVIKKDVDSFHNMNLSLPMSNISDKLIKCEGKFGKLKRINNISKESLRNMETTIFEIKNYETIMNEQIL